MTKTVKVVLKHRQSVEEVFCSGSPDAISCLISTLYQDPGSKILAIYIMKACDMLPDKESEVMEDGC